MSDLCPWDIPARDVKPRMLITASALGHDTLYVLPGTHMDRDGLMHIMGQRSPTSQGLVKIDPFAMVTVLLDDCDPPTEPEAPHILADNMEGEMRIRIDPDDLQDLIEAMQSPTHAWTKDLPGWVKDGFVFLAQEILYRDIKLMKEQILAALAAGENPNIPILRLRGDLHTPNPTLVNEQFDEAITQLIMDRKIRLTIVEDRVWVRLPE